MHWQPYTFVDCYWKLQNSFSKNSRVLEIGSHIVNYSIRNVIDSLHYFGIDLSEGKNVDGVCDASDFALPAAFNVAVSCECFEHNPKFMETFQNMVRSVDENGVVIFTAASFERPEHGTHETTPEQSPGTISVGINYYKNVFEENFNLADLQAAFSDFAFFNNKISNDIYFLGLKSPGHKWILQELNTCNELICRLSQSMLNTTLNPHVFSILDSAPLWFWNDVNLEAVTDHLLSHGQELSTEELKKIIFLLDNVSISSNYTPKLLTNRKKCLWLLGDFISLNILNNKCEKYYGAEDFYFSFWAINQQYGCTKANEFLLKNQTLFEGNTWPIHNLITILNRPEYELCSDVQTLLESRLRAVDFQQQVYFHLLRVLLKYKNKYALSELQKIRSQEIDTPGWFNF